MLDDISYKNYKKKEDIHGTILYPAIMVAPIQKEILSELINIAEVKSVFDPFHGSGTSLYECIDLSDDIRLVGCDINPLANLITKVKLQGVSSNIENDITDIKRFINDNKDTKNHEFPNWHKWFREDIANDLTKIRNAVISIEDLRNRRYFWCMFSNIIRKYSNTQSSTYKLFIKPIEQIDRLENKVISDFLILIESNYHKFQKASCNYELFKCDTLKKIKDFKDNIFDISITSPPYGDNATTVTYGEFSILSLYWIDARDLELEGWELNNYSAIDSHSLGGITEMKIVGDYENILVKPYIEKISQEKSKKVLRFFKDYFEFLLQLCRVTNQYIVMTLGNRTVDRININLTDITKKYLEYNGYERIKVAQREIVNKRTPRKISRVNNQPVSSMNQEFVIVYKKCNSALVRSGS